MRMVRRPPFFPPNRGKNHIWKYFQDLACGAIFSIIIHKKTCQLIPNQWNFTSATLNDIRSVFTQCNIKDNERRICQGLLTIEKADSDLKVHVLHYANELLVRVRLSKTFAKSLNQQKQYEKNVWEKSNDAYSLSIRVQTTINHISIFTFLCFL